MKHTWARLREYLRIAGRQALLYFAFLLVGLASVWFDRSNGTLDNIGAGLIVAAVLYFAVELLSQWQQRITRSDELVLPATFRVNIGPDGKRLRPDKKISDGVMVGEAWQFKADKKGYAVYGPYLRRPLLKGKYTATFRLKIGSTGTGSRQVLRLDIASARPRRGTSRTRTTVLASDFEESDSWQDIPVTLDVSSYEPEAEFRVWSMGTGDTITLDYVQLKRAR